MTGQTILGIEVNSNFSERQQLGARAFLSRHLCAVFGVAALVCASKGVAQAGQASSPAAVPQQQEYLHVGDVVRLKIWREPDLSGDFPIPSDGKVVFPKLGTYDLLHETPSSLREHLVKDYSESLVNPSIDVNVLYRINVLGSVKNPGLFNVDATNSIADVIAMAGGVNPDGNPRNVQVVRDGVTVATSVDQNAPLARNLIRSGDQLYVPQKSWFARNSAPMVAAALTASVYVVTTLLRR